MCDGKVLMRLLLMFNFFSGSEDRLGKDLLNWFLDKDNFCNLV